MQTTSNLKSSYFHYLARCSNNKKRMVFIGLQEEWLKDLVRRLTMNKAFIIGATRIKFLFIALLSLTELSEIFFSPIHTKMNSHVISFKMLPNSIKWQWSPENQELLFWVEVFLNIISWMLISGEMVLIMGFSLTLVSTKTVVIQEPKLLKPLPGENWDSMQSSLKFTLKLL